MFGTILVADSGDKTSLKTLCPEQVDQCEFQWGQAHMTKPNDAALRAQLARVHDELEKATAIHPGEKDLLGGLLTDVLTQASGNGQVAGQKHGIRESLEEQARRFDADHPQLAKVIERLVSVLADMGI